jgi:predicted nucleic acid-binding protein
MGFYKPEDYHVKMSQKFFLDSNIWLQLIDPRAEDVGFKGRYSDFIQKVQRKGLITSNVLQISEVVNRIQRNAFNSFKSNGDLPGELSFKDFRELNDYKALFNESAEEVKLYVKQICALAIFEDGKFSHQEITSLVQSLSTADFNDLYFLRFCEKVNAAMVTHDGDYTSATSIDIVSLNTKYFQ